MSPRGTIKFEKFEKGRESARPFGYGVWPELGEAPGGGCATWGSPWTFTRCSSTPSSRWSPASSERYPSLRPGRCVRCREPELRPSPPPPPPPTPCRAVTGPQSRGIQTHSPGPSPGRVLLSGCTGEGGGGVPRRLLSGAEGAVLGITSTSCPPQAERGGLWVASLGGRSSPAFQSSPTPYACPLSCDLGISALLYGFKTFSFTK